MVQSQQSKLLLYLVMMLGLVLGYLYGSASDPTAVVPVLDLKYQLTSLQSLQSARIDSSILSSDVFKSLRVFGSLPVPSAASGKDNPFQ